ncbi:HET-domain-containing protein [Thozetella sp. PMI_491]|nr:HET-domain-containing protein [Thozetella sp. PMI_491]
MELFEYESLDLKRSAFRLIRLLRGEGSDIDCELFSTYLESCEEDPPYKNDIPYEALSYTWGSITNTDNIIINGRELSVTLNLYIALQYLRSHDQDRILWIDAICINQTNIEERGHQVRHMGKIYKQAERVIFWLGQGTYETNAVLDSLRQLQEESTKHTCKDWKSNDERWIELWNTVQQGFREKDYHLLQKQCEGLESLLSRSWFRRVWILQEVAHAKTATVCCGTRSVSARFFSLAPLLLDVTPDSHCQAVLDIMPGPTRMESWWSRSQDLFTLIEYFGGSQAYDERDLIYALLGISADANNSEVLRADYGKSVQDVIRDAIRFLYFGHIDPTLLSLATKSLYRSSLTKASISTRQMPPGGRHYTTLSKINMNQWCDCCYIEARELT